MAREESVNEESVYSDDKSGNQGVQNKQERHGDRFVHSIGVLESVIAEGEVLVVRFDGIESVEDDEEDP